MKRSGGEALDLVGGMEEDFHEAHHAGILDLDAGYAGGARGNRQGQALEQGDIEMDVEGGCLKASKPVMHRMEDLFHPRQTLRSLFEMNVGKSIAAGFNPEERPELLVVLGEGMLAIGPEHVMALRQAIEGRRELATEASRKAVAEELGDGIGGNGGKSTFTGAFEQAVDGEMTVGNHIAAPRDPGDAGVPVQAHAGRFFPGKLRPKQEGPVLDALPDTFGGEPADGTLEEGRISDGDEGVVMHPVGDTLADALPLHEGMAIEIPGGLKGEKRPNPEHHGSQHVIEDVEVVVREAASRLFQDTVLRIIGGERRGYRAEGGGLFHALENKVDPEALGAFGRSEQGPYPIFLPHVLFSPCDGDAMIPGIGFDPVLAVNGPSGEHLLRDAGNAEDVSKEIDDMLRP
ncbi:MAG TPA: hypothetical protein VMT71_09085 [Syntrophorhabdales bacterium]|nr:hypothetical protein [Syntrophorhabdales bacterium]